MLPINKPVVEQNILAVIQKVRHAADPTVAMVSKESRATAILQPTVGNS